MALTNGSVRVTRVYDCRLTSDSMGSMNYFVCNTSLLHGDQVFFYSMLPWDQAESYPQPSAFVVRIGVAPYLLSLQQIDLLPFKRAINTFVWLYR